jgi:hypothetical protein
MSESKKFIDLQFCTEFDIHSPHYFIILYQLHIQWFIFTIKPHFPSLTFSDFDTFWNTSCISTAGRWKAYSYQYLINAKSIFLYFALATFSSSSLHLNTEYHVSYFKLTQKWKILKHFFVRKFLTGIYHVYNIQLFLNWQWLMGQFLRA